MDALEAMALGLFKAKPIYQAWWTMTLRKYGKEWVGRPISLTSVHAICMGTTS